MRGDCTLKCVQEATTTPSATAAVLMLAPPGGAHTSSAPRTTCRAQSHLCLESGFTIECLYVLVPSTDPVSVVDLTSVQ